MPLPLLPDPKLHPDPRPWLGPPFLPPGGREGGQAETEHHNKIKYTKRFMSITLVIDTDEMLWCLFFPTYDMRL